MSKSSRFFVDSLRFAYSRLGLRRGLGRAVMVLAKGLPGMHHLPVEMIDGRELCLDLREPMCMNYLLRGAIWEEEGETELVRQTLPAGEAAIDVGANVGWYTTLMAELVGPEGRVDAFEPNPRALAVLSRSAAHHPQIHVVAAAVSNCEGEAELHIPNDAMMASLSNRPGATAVQRCRVVTLDGILGDRDSTPVTFVKCDVEGAELPVLRGARALLGRARPPLWMLEFEPDMSRKFGYALEDLMRLFKSVPGAGYEGYRIHSQQKQLVRLPSPADFRFDAVFVPAWMRDRVEPLIGPGLN